MGRSLWLGTDELAGGGGLVRYSGTPRCASASLANSWRTVQNGFQRDGTIREKYNMDSGSSDVNVTTGYKTNVVGFGWTNGVYRKMERLLRKTSSRRIEPVSFCPSTMSRDLSSSRLEAFSDGVIAVIITIMVLDLRVPSTHELANAAAIRADLKLILVYLLSFVQTGIYWVNHHYLIDDVEQVSHGILWANLAFLFTLSLIPFATSWVGERGVSSFSIALYAVACALTSSDLGRSFEHHLPA